MARYIGPIKWLGGIAIGLFIFAFVFGNVAPGMVSETTRNGVLFHAIPFFAAFVGVLLIFILLIVIVALRFNGKVPSRTYNGMEYIAIAGILFGTVCLFNPWSVVPYRYGFLLLLGSMLFFILWSHVAPPRADRDAEFASLTPVQHMVGIVAAVALIILIMATAINVNGPKPPYGLRERVWNSYTEERQAETAAAATAQFNNIELPFLVVFSLFPAGVLYLIAREAVGGRRREEIAYTPSAAASGAD